MTRALIAGLEWPRSADLVQPMPYADQARKSCPTKQTTSQTCPAAYRVGTFSSERG